MAFSLRIGPMLVTADTAAEAAELVRALGEVTPEPVKRPQGSGEIIETPSGWKIRARVAGERVSRAGFKSLGEAEAALVVLVDTGVAPPLKRRRRPKPPANDQILDAPAETPDTATCAESQTDPSCLTEQAAEKLPDDDDSTDLTDLVDVPDAEPTVFHDLDLGTECHGCGQRGHQMDSSLCPLSTKGEHIEPAQKKRPATTEEWASWRAENPARRTLGSAFTETEREMRRQLAVVDPDQGPIDADRPRTRADCEPRLCPHCAVPVLMRVKENEESNDDDRSGREAIRNAHGASSGGFGGKREGDDANLEGGVRLWPGRGGPGAQSQEGCDGELRVQAQTARHVRNAGVQRLEVDDRSLHESEDPQLLGLRRPRDLSLPPLERQLRPILSGHGVTPEPASQPRSQGCERQLRAEELSLGDAEGAGQKQAHISCPNCGGRVRYRRRMGGTDWDWEKHDQGAPAPRLEPGEGRGYYAALNHCRPCGFSGCRYHLAIDVNELGTLHRTFGLTDVSEMHETCALDIADRGGATLEEIGRALNVSRERIRQIETLAIESAKKNAKRLGLRFEAPDEPRSNAPEDAL